MSNFQRRTLLASAAASLATASPFAWAAYPDKAIKIIVPWAPGGSTDAIGRALAQRLSEASGGATGQSRRNSETLL